MCVDNSKYVPGCLNTTDQPDDSYVNVRFPVGVASRPHGYYSDGIISLLVTRFRSDWDDYPDYDHSHQNFILLIVRMFLYFLLILNFLILLYAK